MHATFRRAVSTLPTALLLAIGCSDPDVAGATDSVGTGGGPTGGESGAVSSLGDTTLGSTSTDAETDADTATDTAADTGDPGPDLRNGPTTFATDAMLQAAAARLDQEPYLTAWNLTMHRADMPAVFRTDNTETDQGRWYQRSIEDGEQVVHAALAYRLVPTHPHADAWFTKAKDVLFAAARHSGCTESPLPETCDPASDKAVGQGMVIARAMHMFTYGYTLLYPGLTAAETDELRQWMRNMVALIRASQLARAEANYLGGDRWMNQVIAYGGGLGVIAFALEDEELIAETIDEWDSSNVNDSYREMLEGAIFEVGDAYSPGDLPNAPPMHGEVWDRYRSLSNQDFKGLDYSMLNVRMLLMLAEAAHNNGVGIAGSADDIYQYWSQDEPGGERLDVAFEFLSHFFDERSLVPVGAGTQYYRDDRTLQISQTALFEVLTTRYDHGPDDAFGRALVARDRWYFDHETFGWTALLTHGSHPEWQTGNSNAHTWNWNNPRTASHTDGWMRGNPVTCIGANDALQCTFTDGQTGIRHAQSPDHVNVDVGADGSAVPWIKIRARTSRPAPGESLAVEWTKYSPAEASEFSSYAAATRLVHADYAGDTNYHCYWLDMSAHPDWTGLIRRLRVHLNSDADTPAQSGKVVTIDYIRFAQDNDGACESNTP